MRHRRWGLLSVGAFLVSVVGVSPAEAAPPPGSFNELFRSYPMTVNGSYTPLVGDLDCFADDEAEFSILWYAPGPGADHQWRDFDAGPAGLEHSSVPRTVNGTYEPFVGDFDANGCDDIFWYAPGAGADYVWYGTAGRTFTVRSVTMTANRTPIVGDFDNAIGDDIFWYGEGGGTESIWLGGPTLGIFTARTAPQVGGVDFVTLGFSDSILFYRPGPGADYLWRGIAAGDPSPEESLPTVIKGTYRPINASGILLYGPGSAPDRFIYDIEPDGTPLTLPGTINGTFRTAAMPATSGPAIVFRAPGSAPDYLWVLDGT